MKLSPIVFTWTVEGVMEPHPRARLLAERQFVVGQTYVLKVYEDRSPESHRHFFACLSEAWNNMPDLMQARWPSAEHLRKWALCKAGYCDERTIVAQDYKAAKEIGALLRGLDGFAIITVGAEPKKSRESKRNLSQRPEAVRQRELRRRQHDQVPVRVWTAKSQSRKAMSRQEFAESKEAVLRVVSEVIGVDVTTLSNNAGRAA